MLDIIESLRGVITACVLSVALPGLCLVALFAFSMLASQIGKPEIDEEK